jgi:hypothetical protein
MLIKDYPGNITTVLQQHQQNYGECISANNKRAALKQQQLHITRVSKSEITHKLTEKSPDIPP